MTLSYITSRGNWYSHSWKGKTEKSGGIATNIGVHFFDMLYFVFGELQKNDVYYCSDDKASGFLEYKNARVRWFLSTNQDDLPNHIKLQNQRTFRSIIIDDEELEFSSGFTDLHTLSYKNILLNKGFGLRENLTAVETVSKIRSTKIFKSINNPHPSLTKYL